MEDALSIDHVCTVAGHQGAALEAHGLRHGQNQAIPGLGAEHGQADAGIAAGRFYDGHARF
jgi:hypothetical protein